MVEYNCIKYGGERTWHTKFQTLAFLVVLVLQIAL